MPKYNDRASCKYLTHKYASFHGCTLEEMAIILGCYAAVEIPIMLALSAAFGHYLGGFFGAFLLLFLIFSMLTFFIFMRITAKKIGKARKGRPCWIFKIKNKISDT